MCETFCLERLDFHALYGIFLSSAPVVGMTPTTFWAPPSNSANIGRVARDIAATGCLLVVLMVALASVLRGHPERRGGGAFLTLVLLIGEENDLGKRVRIGADSTIARNV